MALRSNFFKIAGCIIISLLAFGATAQSIDQNILDVIKVKQGITLPKNILSSRSVVLISVPKGSASGDWKKWAAEMQTFFSEVGIDAIAYLLIDELIENPVAQKELTKDIFTKRGVANVITLSVLDAENRLLMTVGPYNRKWTLFDSKSEFWMRETTDIQNIWTEMETLFRSGEYSRKNLLVLDSPEFFDLNISFTSRTERFTKVMESQKIAVPMFVSIDEDPNHIVRFKSDVLNGIEDRSATRTKDLNDQLKAIIDRYPFEAELVNLNEKAEDQWIRSGYGFILYSATGTEKDIRKKLKYAASKTPSEGYMSKFYLKQLRTGNLYFGREWDAGATPFQALENFIDRVRTEFKAEN